MLSSSSWFSLSLVGLADSGRPWRHLGPGKSSLSRCGLPHQIRGRNWPKKDFQDVPGLLSHAVRAASKHVKLDFE